MPNFGSREGLLRYCQHFRDNLGRFLKESRRFIAVIDAGAAVDSFFIVTRPFASLYDHTLSPRTKREPQTTQGRRRGSIKHQASSAVSLHPALRMASLAWLVLRSGRQAGFQKSLETTAAPIFLQRAGSASPPRTPSLTPRAHELGTLVLLLQFRAQVVLQEFLWSSLFICIRVSTRPSPRSVKISRSRYAPSSAIQPSRTYEAVPRGMHVPEPSPPAPRSGARNEAVVTWIRSPRIAPHYHARPPAFLDSDRESEEKESNRRSVGIAFRTNNGLPLFGLDSVVLPLLVSCSIRFAYSDHRGFTIGLLNIHTGSCSGS
ncbi:hypothetical protein MSAN_00832000 [Mycena sanguinolenta]|uniref:Uncharacterized protein n=1 Tax=Mycena sanguinolenta TaxID=230812 RepID=A0A8H6YV45_9AGAR|nr:hypothetical protein MSAN_00832000 [Mycena sanguinolenta]